MTNTLFELNKSLSVYYPHMEDSELNKITLDFVRFFTELAMIENENSEETSVSADS